MVHLLSRASRRRFNRRVRTLVDLWTCKRERFHAVWSRLVSGWLRKIRSIRAKVVESEMSGKPTPVENDLMEASRILYSANELLSALGPEIEHAVGENTRKLLAAEMSDLFVMPGNKR